MLDDVKEWLADRWASGLLGQCLIGILLAVFIGGAGMGGYNIVNAKSADECLPLKTELGANNGAIGHHIVLLDPTDSLNDGEDGTIRDRVLKTVEHEMDTIPRCDRLSLYTVEEVRPDLTHEVAGSPWQVPHRKSDAAGPDQNPETFEDDWNQQFRDPVRNAVLKTIRRKDQDSSPILEAVWLLSRLADFGPETRDRKLVIISDMLQKSALHGNGLTHYERRPDFEGFSDSAFARRYPLDLHGVTVEIEYLQRNRTLRFQTLAHCSFWRKLFERAGAKKVVIVDGPKGCSGARLSRSAGQASLL